MKRVHVLFIAVCIFSFLSLSVFGVTFYSAQAQTFRGGVLVDEDPFETIKTSAVQSTDKSGIPEIDEQLSVDVSPQNPRPGDTVTISVATYGSNVGAANITWQVDGKTMLEGTGKTKFTVVAGNNGQAQRVVMKFTSEFGKVSVREIIVRPQTVDIVYESRSYTPPFYKGRSLYGPQGNLVFLAVPNLVDSRGVAIDPSNLIYTWTVDGEVDGANSGYGKNLYYFTGPVLIKDSEVNVQVTSKDGTAQGDATMSVSPSNPFVATYENRPLLGILFNQTIGSNFTLQDKEVTIEAFPYFFDTPSKTGANLKYSWGINNTAIVFPSNQNKIVLRNTTEESGRSDISVGLENNNQFLQVGSKILSVLFNNPDGSAF